MGSAEVADREAVPEAGHVAVHVVAHVAARGRASADERWLTVTSLIVVTSCFVARIVEWSRVVEEGKRGHLELWLVATERSILKQG